VNFFAVFYRPEICIKLGAFGTIKDFFYFLQTLKPNAVVMAQKNIKNFFTVGS